MNDSSLLKLGPSKEATRTLLESLGGRMPSGDELKQAWADHKYEMMANAWLVMTRAHNWRPEKPVKIGCCVLGHDGYGNFSASFVGWNNTPRPLSDAEKHHFKPCAEKYAILKCINAGHFPVGACIWTEHNQPDDVTGLSHHTFCPCSYCVAWMEGLHLPWWFYIGVARTRLDSDPPSDKWWVEDTFKLDEMSLMHQRSLERRQG